MLYNNKYIAYSLMLFLTLYGSKIAPQLPNIIEKLLQHPIVKFIFMFIIVFINSRNYQLSILLSVGLLTILILLNNFDNNIFQKFQLNIPKLEKMNNIENTTVCNKNNIESSDSDSESSDSDTEKFNY